MLKKLFLITAFSTTLLSSQHAHAYHRYHRNNHLTNHLGSHSVSDMMVHTGHYRYRHNRRYAHQHIIQCVGYVHMASDFKIHGDAREWWAKAAGLYERGNIPEKGSVLAFKPVRRMRLGHVAMVNRILDRRTITIDQAHWGENKIVHDVKVIDISPRNNWTSVRVELSHNKGNFGSVYPTHGFIYHRAAGTGKAVYHYSNSASDMVNNDETVQTASLAHEDPFPDERPPSSLVW